MDCTHYQANHTRKMKQKTLFGYNQYRCSDCNKKFNERTGTRFSFIEYPTEVIMMVVQYYYRFKVSLDDVVELMEMRGFKLSHQTTHNWAQTFGLELGIKCRLRRKGKLGKKWHADVTCVCIKGNWYYLYRAIDKEGNLADIYLSDIRGQATVEAFFKQVLKKTDIISDQITTNKEPAFYPAIKNVFGDKIKHRDNKYMNNRREQNHRGIKSLYKVMKGFKNPFSALIFCTVFEEIRQFFRMKKKTRSECRKLIVPRITGINKLMAMSA